MSTNKQLEVLAKLGVDTLTEDEYEVQEHTLCGWENTWTTYDDDDNEVPSTFTSKQGAEEELKDFFYQCHEAVVDGHMTDEPDPDDFRIVKVA
jgi:magnesium-transporting ATPase (P-type)